MSLLPLAAHIIRGEPILDALITILIIVVILAIIWWVLSLIPMAEPFGKIVRVLVALIAAVAVIVILLRLI